MQKVKLVKFGASWCRPCKMLDPILKELEQELTEVEFIYYDIETDVGKAKSEELEVMSVPTVFIYKNNEIVDKFTGFLPKPVIMDKIKQYMQ